MYIGVYIYFEFRYYHIAVSMYSLIGCSAHLAVAILQHTAPSAMVFDIARLLNAHGIHLPKCFKCKTPLRAKEWKRRWVYREHDRALFVQRKYVCGANEGMNDICVCVYIYIYIYIYI